jgi:hypothetical protein
VRSEVVDLTELNLLVRRLSHECEGALAGEEPAAHKQLKASRNYSTRAETRLERRPLGLVISAAPRHNLDARPAADVTRRPCPVLQLMSQGHLSELGLCAL